MIHGSNPQFFHVVVRPARTHAVLLRSTDYRSLLTTLNQGLARQPIRLICYALLPSHWELVAGPVHSSDLVKLVTWVSATQTERLLQIGRLRGHAQSRRSFAAEPIAPATDLVRVCRQVERQPVELRLARRAEDWPWSSIADRFRLLSRVPLVSTCFLASRSWLDLVNAPVFASAPAVQPILRDSAENPGRLTGRSEGSDHFIGMSGLGHQNQTDAHIERPKHLGIRNLAGSL